MNTTTDVTPDIAVKAFEAEGLPLPPSGAMARRAAKRVTALITGGDPVPITDADRAAVAAAQEKRASRARRNRRRLPSAPCVCMLCTDCAPSYPCNCA